MERCRESQDKNFVQKMTLIYPTCQAFISSGCNLSSSLAPLISVARVVPAKGSVHEANTANKNFSYITHCGTVLGFC